MVCFNEYWSPGIGDPSLMGWFTVFMYALTAFLSGRHYWQIEQRFQWRRNSRPGTLWLLITLLLIALTLNKQLDLQSALTGLGKCMAQAQGWYNDRQVIQVIFLATIALAMSTTIGLIAWHIRDIIADQKLALLGLFVLLSFVMMRALSFHYFDALINSRILGLKLNWIFELSGIVMLMLAAIQVPKIRRPIT